MLIIKKLSGCIHHYLDSMNASGFKIKIDHFSFNNAHNNICVIYRLGRQKFLNKMNLDQFQREYFQKISNYDQHRLTKFSTLLHILDNFFTDNACNKECFSHFIAEQVKNEPLF